MYISDAAFGKERSGYFSPLNLSLFGSQNDYTVVVGDELYYSTIP
jgi:hypothetical protein